MTPDQSESQRDPLDLLIEQFLASYRAGEPVTVDAFADGHPEHREQLRELLPTLLALEQVKRDRVSSGSSPQRVALPQLERLGDFRIERELGRGGMGVVFEAVQESLDRRVALKVLPQASLLTGNQLERFRREAQIAARLHHTNIVPVYGSGESDGYHWYAMQFIAGVSLDRWRQQQVAHAPRGSGQWAARARFVARIGAMAASALHYAHGQGTLHRDIKPANFLLDGEDHLWVTDFGLAKALEAEGLTNSGDLLGTLQYMAPEQFAGHYDVRSEIYALGITLYELLTLQPAFRSRDRSELIAQVREQRIEPLVRVCPEVPRDLVVIIGKAIARDPRDRYATAQALQDDLEAFLEDRAIQARRLSTLTTIWRWCRRNRAAATLSAVAAVAVVVAAVTGWVAYVVTGDALDKARESAELARVEGARAEANLQQALTMSSEMFDALVGRDTAVSFDEDPDSDQVTVVVHEVSPRDVELLRLMLAFYDRFARDNAESESLRYETARAYRRVGAIQVRLGGRDNLVAAEQALQKALAGFRSLAGRDVRQDLALVHADLGRLHERLGHFAEAADQFEKAVDLLEQLPDADTPALRIETARVLFELARSKGRALWRRRPAASRGREHGAEVAEAFERASSILRQLLSERPDDPAVLRLEARVLRESPDPADGQRALAIQRRLVAEHPREADYRFELVESLMAVLRRRSFRGPRLDLDQRHELLVEAEREARALIAAQPQSRQYRAQLVHVLAQYADEMLGAEFLLEGEALVRRRQETREKLEAAVVYGAALLAEGGDDDPRVQMDLLHAHAWLAFHQQAEGELDLAKAHVVAVLAMTEELLDDRSAGGAARTGPDRPPPPLRVGPPRGPGTERRGTRPGSRLAEAVRVLRRFAVLVREIADRELSERVAAVLERARRPG